MKSLVLFNSKGGVGTTTLAFNIAHMMSRQGLRVVVLDCDPQCSISSLFLSEEALFELWEEPDRTGRTVARCVDLVRRGEGDVVVPALIPAADNLWLLPGELTLSRFEQTLTEEWPRLRSTGGEQALNVIKALDVLSSLAAEKVASDLVLFDVGPSLGALNRAALTACDAVLLPLAPDFFSVQGMKTIGPMLREWQNEWQSVCAHEPCHRFEPIGYLVQQHLARSDRPVAGYRRWFEQIPQVFHEHVLGEQRSATTSEDDPYCIALLKHFASLVPLAQLARKPLFDLKRADGVAGGQVQAVAHCRREFEHLALALASRLDLPLGPAIPSRFA
jgi:chromosome partitioning protein